MHRYGVQPFHMSGHSQSRGARRGGHSRIVHRQVQPHTDRADYSNAVLGEVSGGWCLFLVRFVFITFVIIFSGTSVVLDSRDFQCFCLWMGTMLLFVKLRSIDKR